MSGAPGDPLARVLDRLLARERATKPVPAAGPGRSRRALVIARGESPDSRDASRWAAGWLAVLGRRPLVVEIVPTTAPASDAAPVLPLTTFAGEFPRARLGCAQGGGVEASAAAIEALQRLESDVDLLLVEMATARAHELRRAARLAGALVLPVGDGGIRGDLALGLAQELHGEVQVWPFSRSPRDLDDFLARLGTDAVPFDPRHLHLAQEIAYLPALPCVLALVPPGAVPVSIEVELQQV